MGSSCNIHACNIDVWIVCLIKCIAKLRLFELCHLYNKWEITMYFQVLSSTSWFVILVNSQTNLFDQFPSNQKVINFLSFVPPYLHLTMENMKTFCLVVLCAII